MTSTADTNHATIADRVAQLQRGMAGQLPDEVLNVFGAEQARLQAGGLPIGVAVAGDAMPDAQLLDVHGAATTLAKAVGGRSAVVVLYRGAWCPYCNLALRAYQEDLVPQLAQRGIALVAISPQKPDGSLSMQEKNELSFTVLSDPAIRWRPGWACSPHPPMLPAPLSVCSGLSCRRPTLTGLMRYQCRR